MLVMAFVAVHTLCAQQQKITLDLKDATLLQVLERLEKLTDYTFLYSDAHIRSIDHLQLHFEQADIETILQHCLEKASLGYRIEDKTIILIPEERPEILELQPEKWFIIRGKVQNEQDIVLPGVNIYIKNSPGIGNASDGNGLFSIYVRKGDVVVFSSVGYRTEEYFVKHPVSEMVIRMKESLEEMEEIQVVGYGIQRRVSSVGAISNMPLQKYSYPVTSFSNAIAGSMSGIIGVQRSGEPGEDISEFWIRGISTFGAGEKALVLIDGVERGSLDDLIPQDIESFSILKDATATAVYGARGANGVLLIRTRRGKAGRMRIQAGGKTMWSCLPRLPEYVEGYDYALLSNEAHVVRGEASLYNKAVLQIIQNGLDPEVYPDVDWQKELLKKWTWGALVNVSCSGGGDLVRYYVGGSYRTNDAAYREAGHNTYHTNVRRRQYDFRTNLDIDITRSTSLGVDFASHLVTMNRPGIGKTDKLWQIQADLNPLVIPLRYPNGYYPCYGDENQASPLVLLNETGYVSEFRNTLETKLELKQDLSRIIPGWQASASIAYDVRMEEEAARTKMPDLYCLMGRDQHGSLILERRVEQQKITYRDSSSSEYQLYFEGKTTYERIFGQHRIGGLLLFNLSHKQSTLSQDLLESIPMRFMGLAGRLTWSWQDIYLAEFNFGYNGSGNFPRGKRFGFFPSMAFGWRLSEYEWWKKHFGVIGSFKLRYSWGIVGNDQILNTRFPYLTYIDANAPGYGFGDDGKNGVPGVAVKEEGVRNLRWEKAEKQNFGLEMEIAGRLSIELDYFRDYRKGIFMRRGNIPDVVGITSRPYGNVGRLKNWGYEGTFTYHDRIGRINWEVRGNFTYMDNKVLEYDESPGVYAYQNHKGKRLELTRGLVALGYFRDSLDILNSPRHLDLVRPGDIKYKDINGDGVIDDNDVVPIGNASVPRLQYGFAANVQWKGWDLGVFFRGTGAVDYFLGGSGYAPFINRGVGNVLSVAGNKKNRWIPAWYSGDPSTENPGARFPRLSYGYHSNFQPSTHWLCNGAYLRLKTVEIGYSFPFTVLRKLAMSRLRVSVTGDNLHVWDKVKLWDPEQASSNGAVYPLTRSFLLNVEIEL